MAVVGYLSVEAASDLTRKSRNRDSRHTSFLLSSFFPFFFWFLFAPDDSLVEGGRCDVQAQPPL